MNMIFTFFILFFILFYIRLVKPKNFRFIKSLILLAHQGFFKVVKAQYFARF